MENGLSMNQELRQRQAISAYQYQSLHILHLGNAQVGEFLKKEYLENPFMELKEGFSREETQWLEFYKSNTGGAVIPKPSPSMDKTGEREYGRGFQDWRMDLKEQLYGGSIPKDRRHLLEGMILLLDDHGFLPFPDNEGSRLLGVPVKEYRSLKKQLMHLEPEGMGCSSMGEFFLFQLEGRGIPVPAQFCDLCMNHLESITKMTYVQIGRLIHASFQEVKRWVRVLGALEPYPLQDGGQEGHVEAVVPDILIERSGDGLQVRVNDFWKFISSIPFCSLRSSLDPSYHIYGISYIIPDFFLDMNLMCSYNC